MDQAAMFSPAEQDSLPGMGDAGRKVKGRRPSVRRDSPAQIPLMAPVYDELPEWRMSPYVPPPSQLTLGAEQMMLSDVEPAPVQLSLFPDPPLWEGDPPAPAAPRRGRLARRRGKLGISPGQRTLF